MAPNSDDTQLVRIAIVLVAALILLPMLFVGLAMVGYGSMMGGFDHGMWGGGVTPGWFALFGVLMQLLFLGALIVGGYLVYREVAGSDGSPDRALEELRLAYARGDLTDEEYERRREKLEDDS